MDLKLSKKNPVIQEILIIFFYYIAVAPQPQPIYHPLKQNKN